MCRVISVSNQKGGVSKSTTVMNLGVGLAKEGKKVLLIDGDPQGSLTASMGYPEPDEIPETLANIMMAVINEEEIHPEYAILHHNENVDLLPGNIELSGLEITLGNVMSREMILRDYVEMMREHYDYIIIDCMPSLGMLTINAIVAADSVLIPVQAAYLPVKGLQQLIRTIAMVKKRLNRRLRIEGILLTMVDFRTNYAKDITEKVKKAYGSTVKIFENVIPLSIKAAEATAEGVSIFKHCPKDNIEPYRKPEKYRKVKKEELAAFEETVSNMIRSLILEASDIASWVFVKKYVEGWTLEQMIEDMPHAVKFIVSMDTLFEKNMGNLPEDEYKN